jgi:ribosomal protein S18 acetylase RimI-like enzyme
MESVFGSGALKRFDRYEAAQKKHLKSEPHHYLVAIGVHPEYQGEGYGGELLRAAIDIAEADVDSAGIGLDTGSESNQKFYEKYGFELIATEPLDDKMMRLMFRPNVRSRK